jgi:hypothetical protein
VREESSAATEDPNDDFSLRERRFGEVDFGPDDPGVTVITADKGGNINRYRWRQGNADGQRTERWPPLHKTSCAA